MLNFQFDQFFWRAKARLPSWAGYHVRSAGYSGDGFRKTSDGSVSITFAPEGRDESPLNLGEIALVQWLLDHDAEVAPAALNGLLAEYPRLQASYGYEGEERDEFMPDVSSTEDFRTLIQLDNVNIHPMVKNGIPYLGYAFDCSWDIEHGLGILMNGTRVVEVGGVDTAALLWVAERDAGAA